MATRPANGPGVDAFTELLVFAVRTVSAYLLGAGQALLARRFVEWGLHQAPGSAQLWALRGRILLRAAAARPGDRGPGGVLATLEEARTAYARAEELDPGDPELWREHALVLQNLAWALAAQQGARPRPDLLEAAAAQYGRVLAAQPRRAEVLHERAMTHVGMRAALDDKEAQPWLEAALADLDRSLELRPHAPEACLHRAEVRGDLATIAHRAGTPAVEARLRQQALADCAGALRLRPSWAPPLLRQAMEATALARLGDNPADRADLAIAGATAVLQAQPRNLAALVARADARVVAACRLAQQGDARGALVWRQALADLDSAIDTAGWRGREDVLALRGEARGEWAEALERAGDVSGALQAWGEALADLERAVDDDPASARRLLARARALAALARLQDGEATAQTRRGRAVEDCSQVLAVRPDHPAALVARALARCGPQSPAEEGRAALADAERVLTLHPGHRGGLAARRRALVTVALALPAGEERTAALNEATAACALALASDAQDAAAHYDQARVLFLSGRVAAAYAALEQAVHLAPGTRQVARRDPVWTPVVDGAGFRRLVGG